MSDLLTPAELAAINDSAHDLRAARFFKEADRLFALLRHIAALEARTPAPALPADMEALLEDAECFRSDGTGRGIIANNLATALRETLAREQTERTRAEKAEEKLNNARYMPTQEQLESIYAALPKVLAPWREVARSHGYSMAFHGSLARDIDIAFMPWIGSPSTAEALIDGLLAAADFAICPEKTNPGEVTVHGRRRWVILGAIPGPAYFDISVWPTQAERDAAIARAEKAEAERDEERAAHDAIASICHEAEVDGGDGTSIRLVRALKAERDAAIARAEKVHADLDAAREEHDSLALVNGNLHDDLAAARAELVALREELARVCREAAEKVEAAFSEGYKQGGEDEGDCILISGAERFTESNARREAHQEVINQLVFTKERAESEYGGPLSKRWFVDAKLIETIDQQYVVQTAREMGGTARANDASVKHNPFLEGIPEFTAWADGWNAVHTAMLKLRVLDGRTWDEVPGAVGGGQQ